MSVPVLPPPIEAFTQQDLLDLFDRLLPVHYLEPLKSPGPGYEVLQCFAAIMARCSLALERLGAGSFILSATGGTQATGTVQFARPAVNGEGIDVTIKAGTLISCSKSGRQFATTADVLFHASDLGPKDAPVQAVADGYEYNVPGIVTALDGTVLPGEIDTIDTLVEDPAVGDLTFTVSQTAATTGGVDAFLDQLGADRGIIRGTNEQDAAYRARVRSLPDNISPDAVSRALQQLLLPVGQNFQFIETWDIEYQTCWDGPPTTIAGSNYDPSLFCYDDPRPRTPFRNRWLDENDSRGGFVVVVPEFGPVNDVGMAYDDTANGASALTNPLGARALSAYDVPATLGFGYLQGSWDGYDLARASLMKTVYETLQNIKAAGIAAVLELQGE